MSSVVHVLKLLHEMWAEEIKTELKGMSAAGKEILNNNNMLAVHAIIER